MKRDPISQCGAGKQECNTATGVTVPGKKLFYELTEEYYPAFSVRIESEGRPLPDCMAGPCFR